MVNSLWQETSDWCWANEVGQCSADTSTIGVRDWEEVVGTVDGELEVARLVVEVDVLVHLLDSLVLLQNFILEVVVGFLTLFVSLLEGP